MPKLIVLLAALAAAPFALGQNATPPPSAEQGKPVALREGTEWTHMWLPGLTSNDKPYVLLVGDSITQDYQGSVSKLLASKARVGYFVTSLAVCDPAFEPALQAVLAVGKFDAIHFNNGLHGIGYTEKQYEEGYLKILALIRRMQPAARVTLALSTPLQEMSPKAFLNPRMDLRNNLVKSIAKNARLDVNDLNTPMLGHSDYYRDPYHYKGPAVAIQADLVAKAVEASLGTSK